MTSLRESHPAAFPRSAGLAPEWELIPGPAPSLVVVRELVGELVMEMALALELEPELALVLGLVCLSGSRL